MSDTDFDNDAIATLMFQLRLAQTAFNKKGDHGRTGSIIALLATVSLMAKMGVSRELLDPILAVASSLQDLDNGKVQKLLKPLTKNHRPPDSILETQFRAWCAAAMHLFMLSGMNAGEAARSVVSGTKHWQSEITKTLTPAKVKKWRERVSGGNRRDDYDTVSYFALIEDVQSTGADPKISAQKLLKNPPGIAPENPINPPS